MNVARESHECVQYSACHILFHSQILLESLLGQLLRIADAKHVDTNAGQFAFAAVGQKEPEFGDGSGRCGAYPRCVTYESSPIMIRSMSTGLAEANPSRRYLAVFSNCSMRRPHAMLTAY